MNLTMTDVQFLIEAIQQKADSLIEQLRQDAEQDILRNFTQHLDEQFDAAYAEHIKTAPKRRGRPPLNKTAQGARK